MLIPKEDRKKIHQHLFQGVNLLQNFFHKGLIRNGYSSEGVVVAKKDFNQPKHEEIDTKNLYVIKALQSLTSKGFVKTQFSWQYYYYTLTDEGLTYLRESLNIPEGVVPKTLLPEQIPTRQSRRPRGPRGDDSGYRRRARD